MQFAMDSCKKTVEKAFLVIGNPYIGGMIARINDTELQAYRLDEQFQQDIHNSITALTHSSSVNAESFKDAVIELSSHGFSMIEIKALILQIENKRQYEEAKSKIHKLSESIASLKCSHVYFKPTKSLEEKYRDKLLSKSIWNTQKRPWIKNGTGRRKTKRSESLKNSKNDRCKKKSF